MQKDRLNLKMFSILTLITFLGAILRMYFLLKGGSLRGDEFTTLEEAASLGRNMHAISYFFLLHWWMKISQSDIWIRLLSSLFGIASIPMVYLFGREFQDKRFGAVLAASLALSPISIHFSAQARFYAPFLFWSIVSLWIYFLWINRRRKLYLWLCLLSNTLLFTSHLFGAFLIYLEFLSWLIKEKKKKVFIMSITLPLLLLSFFIFGSNRIWGCLWPVIMRYVGTLDSIYAQTRGLSISGIAKQMFMFYHLLFGGALYPYSLGVSIMVLFAVYYAFQGLKTSISIDIHKATFAILALVYLPVIFLGIDAISPAPQGGFQSRYAIFLLPILLALFCMNVVNKKRFIKYSSVIFIITALSIGVYYEALALNTGLDWKEAMSRISHKGTHTLILYDGRSIQAVERYLRHDSLFSASSIYNPSFKEASYEKVYIVYNDWQAGNIKMANDSVSFFDTNYKHKLIYYRYPTTIYEMELEPRLATDNLIPPRFMPIEFQDVPLPICIKFGEKEYRVDNCLTLKKEESYFRVDLTKPAEPKNIFLISNTTGINHTQNGEVIGAIKLKHNGEVVSNLPIRYNIESFNWMERGEALSSLNAIYKWHKKIAFIGRWGYSEKYKDGLASIYACKITLARPIKCDRIEISFHKDEGKLHLWGLFLD